MKCDVPFCAVDLARPANCSGITFHSLPKDPSLRKEWVEALRTNSWSPEDETFICSKHFKEEDFFETQDGDRKLYDTAIPIQITDLDAPAAVKVCRICLVLGAKTYDMNRYRKMIQQITGIYVMDEEPTRLPQRVCWECASRLTAAVAFRTKALLSNNLLQGILRKSSYVKIRDVQSLNRTYHGLKSKLVQKVFDSEFFVKIDSVMDNIDTDVLKLDDTDILKIDDTDILKIDDIKTEEPIIDNEYEYNEDKTNIFVEVEEQNINVNNYVDESNMSEELPSNSSEDSETDEEKILKPKAVKRKAIIEDTDDYDTYGEEFESKEVETESNLADSDDESDIELVTIYKHLFEDMKDTEGRPIKRRPKKKRRRPQNYKPIDETLFTITPLTPEEEIKEMQKRQELPQYMNSTYKCTLCVTGFQNKDAYSRHAMKHSEQAGAYECPICKTRWKKQYSLGRHMQKHNIQYNCNVCEYTTRHKNAVHEHMRYHAGDKYQCSKCPSSFGKRSTYLSHLRLSHTSEFVCELCGYTFVNERGVYAHKNKTHKYFDETKKLEGPHCDTCNVTFLSKDAHDTHLRVSAKHLKNEHDPLRIRNEMSSKRIKLNEGGARRRPRYSGVSEKDVAVDCEQCGVSLRNFLAYSRHFEKEHPEVARTLYPAMKYPTMCEYCGKIFNSIHYLETHKWVHTGRKQYQCDQCNKCFTQKSTLIQHMVRHTGDKNANKCAQCGKCFTFSSNLKRHMFLHTGLKPFKCDLCDKCYPSSDQLKMHKNHFHLNKPWPKKKKKNKEECVEN